MIDDEILERVDLAVWLAIQLAGHMADSAYLIRRGTDTMRCKAS